LQRWLTSLELKLAHPAHSGIIAIGSRRRENSHETIQSRRRSRAFGQSYSAVLGSGIAEALQELSARWAFLEGLPAELIYELWLLKEIGIRHLNADVWPNILNDYKQRYQPVEFAIRRIIDQHTFAECVAESLDVLRERGIAVDDLLAQTVTL
jgi:hypothetical protein